MHKIFSDESALFELWTLVLHLLPGHVEGGPPCPGADVEDLHAGLEVDELEELPGGGLAAHTHPGLAEYLLVSGDAIPGYSP